MKRLLLSTAASLSLAFTAAPALAQEETQPGSDQLAQMGEMFAGLFTSEPLTAEQEARLPAAQGLIETMLPDGFYAKMMGEMMSSTLQPLMSMISGPQAANMILGGRLNVEPSVTEALSEDEKIELATLLDPSFAERGSMMQNMLQDIMVETAVMIEPGFKQGMAKAYAVRFDDAQLADIAAFFETPTGAHYARENIRLMADPQVMSASMQAMPAMMQQFGDLGAKMEEAMAALPPERGVEDLNQAERDRMAELLGVEESSLDAMVNAPAGSPDEAY